MLRNNLKMALRPFTGETATQLYQEAELFHQGVKVKLLPVDDESWSKGRPWVQDTSHKSLFKLADVNAAKPRFPLTGTFLKLEGNVMLSVLKWSEDGVNPVIRLYNIETSASQISLSVNNMPDQIRANRCSFS